MSIDEKRRFYIALLKGSARLVAISAMLTVTSTSVGMMYDYFDFYPHFLNFLQYDDFPDGYLIRPFLAGLVSLPFLTVLFILTAMLFLFLYFIVLLLGGYYD